MKFNLRAKRTARILFKVALEKNRIDAVNEEMSLIRESVKLDPQKWALLSNPVIPLDEKTAIFRKKFSGNVVDFLRFIMEKRDTVHLNAIADEFSKLVMAYKKVEEVLLETTFQLSDGEKSALSEKISRLLSSRVIIIEKVVPEIIGGVVIHLKDKVIDISFRSQLKEMEGHLTDYVKTS